MDVSITITIFNILSFSTAFFLLTVSYIREDWRVRILYFTLIFTVMLITNVVYPVLSISDLYICCAITYFIINKACRNALRSACIAVSALVYFQMAVMLMGSIIFLVFAREDVYGSFGYNFFMQIWVIACSIILREHKKAFFYEYRSRRLLISDLVFKSWFMLLMNLILPLAFYKIEIVYYIVCQLFIILAVIFFWIIKYAVKIEADNYRHAAESEKLKIKSEDVHAKHEDIIKFKHYYHKLYKSLFLFIKDNDMKGLQTYFHRYITPVNENMEHEKPDYSHLGRIEIAAIKALLMELADSISMLSSDMDIELILNVENPIKNTLLDSINIFTILNIFIENAVEEVTVYKQGYIYILLTENESQFTFRIENSINGYKSMDKTSNSHKGLLIVKKILEKNKGVRIQTVIELNKFIQVMVVEYG